MTQATKLKPCPCCERPSDTIARRHMSTAYAKEESNYLTSCQECFDEAEEYWRERWAEYYTGYM